MTNATSRAGNNLSLQRGWRNYTPVLTGATDNPVVTASTTIGRFLLLGAVVLFNYKLVSTSMTKTTLTDVVNISLPIPAATLTGQVQTFLGRVENATAVANMILGEIASASQTATFRNYALAASSSQLTYAVTTPGLGVLTNTITFNGSGSYEYVAN